jgi:hypothetical protein
MNTPVSFPLAKLLKEKEFDEPCKLCVEDGDERPLPFNCGNTIHRNSLHPYYSAPTISDVVMWLYENHKIWISVDPENDTDTWFHTITHNKSETVFGNYSSLTEAYEAGIEDVLNNMI